MNIYHCDAGFRKGETTARSFFGSFLPPLRPKKVKKLQKSVAKSSDLLAKISGPYPENYRRTTRPTASMMAAEVSPYFSSKPSASPLSAYRSPKFTNAIGTGIV
jgi:hypothetical protein